LPRGLGEDPLVRQKKVRRRASAQSTVLAPASDDSGNVSPVQTAVQAGTVVDVSSSQLTSYNDVFFRKRSESSIVVVSSDPNHDAAAPETANLAVAQFVTVEPVAAECFLPEPIATVPIMTTPAVETPVVSIVAPAPDAVEAFTPIPDTNVIHEAYVAEAFTPAPDVAEAFTAPDTPMIQQEAHVAEPSAPAMDAASSAPALQTATQAAETEPQKRGFFKRVFGRFQK
jgi:hypothetical protein